MADDKRKDLDKVETRQAPEKEKTRCPICTAVQGTPHAPDCPNKGR